MVETVLEPSQIVISGLDRAARPPISSAPTARSLSELVAAALRPLSEAEISLRITNRGYNEVVKAIWNWACKPFLPCQQDYIFSVPANERWQVVVTGVLMLLIVPAIAVGAFLHWIGFAIALTLFVVVGLFFDGWNEVPLKVIRRRNLRDWKAGFLQGVLVLTIIPFALDVFSRDLMMVYSLVVGSLLTVPYMKLVRQMYLRAGENAPPPSFDLTPPPVED